MCGFQTEIEMKITDEHPQIMECPECKKMTLKRYFGKKMNFLLSPNFKDDKTFNYDQRPSGRKQYF